MTHKESEQTNSKRARERASSISILQIEKYIYLDPSVEGIRVEAWHRQGSKRESVRAWLLSALVGASILFLESPGTRKH